MSKQPLSLHETGTHRSVLSEDVITLGRQLRSSKGNLFVHVAFSKALAKAASLAAAAREPLPGSGVDSDAVFNKEIELDPRRKQAEAADTAQGQSIQITQTPAAAKLSAYPTQIVQQNPAQNNNSNHIQAQAQPPVRDINMAEERILLPSPFRGTADEDPAEFCWRLSNYMQYKNIDGPDKLRLAKAMLVESACDWLEKLPDPTKADYALLAEAFKNRYIKPPVLRFRSACEMFGKKQGIDETVDAYASRLRGLAKRVDVNDDTLLYAFVSGLKPKTRQLCFG